VFIYVIAVQVVKMSIMQIVDMYLMTHGDMSTIRPVLVSVIGGMLQRAVSHGASSLMGVQVRNLEDAVAREPGQEDIRPTTCLLNPRSWHCRVQAATSPPRANASGYPREHKTAPLVTGHCEALS
jgi:hypothetical protein